MRIATVKKSRWIGGTLAGVAAVLCLVPDVAAARAVTPAQAAPAQRMAPVQGRQGVGPGRRLGRPLLLGAAARRLGLTDAQKDQLRAVAQSRRDEWRTLGDRMRIARRALAQATSANPIDEAAIRQRSADVAAVAADIAVARARARAEMMQVLTPEQQTQLETMRPRARDRIAARRQPRRQ